MDYEHTDLPSIAFLIAAFCVCLVQWTMRDPHPRHALHRDAVWLGYAIAPVNQPPVLVQPFMRFRLIESDLWGRQGDRRRRLEAIRYLPQASHFLALSRNSACSPICRLGDPKDTGDVPGQLTSPSHGGNTGSNPLGDASKINMLDVEGHQI
jgi:hypothetical protein